jgi:micrococcal nuclease
MLHPLLTVLLLLLPDAAHAFEVRIVHVQDGDTITVLNADRTQHKVRLSAIDAPELGQPYGRAARHVLAELMAGQVVEIGDKGTDRYGRTVAVVLVDDMNVNREMVRQGAAWAYLKYLDDPVLVELEAEARVAQRGLWALQADQIMPPWEWRRAQRGR